MNSTKESTYKLRCSLLGHSMDVRAVDTSSDGHILTASRDKSAILWTENADSHAYEQNVVYTGHTEYVTSACLVPPSENYTNGMSVTGSRDKKILVYLRFNNQPSYTLTGHTDTISCLHWENGTLISGSWDHTARVWVGWECVHVLQDHSGPLWGVTCFVDTFITASADKTIKAWKGDKVSLVLTGHTDCVRGLSVCSGDRLLSCSNDAAVRVWSKDGICVTTHYAHTNFIYSISALSNGGFITGGEDRTLRVWSPEGEVKQVIHLPAQSVWAVAVLPNLDIVAGTSDGICRIFTNNPGRMADEETQKEFESSLASCKVASEDLGGIKKSELPDKTCLYAPGKKEGQTKMVREGDKVICYSWSQVKQQWESVGEVVGGTGGSATSSGKVLYQGREYDYVFDVDLDEGRILKLPYNRGMDPWVVAQAFIDKHQLPQEYLDQVANFINKNAEITSGSSSEGAAYSDPFTGGSRYIPGGSLNSNGSLHPSDPFTGSGRYVPPAIQNTASGFDACKYFPQKKPLIFESVNKDGILHKLRESNASVSGSQLTEDEIRTVVESAIEVDVVATRLIPLETALQWPVEKVWPVLDVLRLALRSQSVQDMWLQEPKGTILITHLMQFLAPPNHIPTQLLTLRCLANMACHSQGSKLLLSTRDIVLNACVKLTPLPNKNMEIAATTLVLNFCVIVCDSLAREDHCQALSAASTLALSVSDTEAQFRVLVGTGTLLCIDEEVRQLAVSLDIKMVAESLCNSNQIKVRECANHILNMVK